VKKGVVVLVVVCAIPVVLWATAAPLSDRFIDLATTLNSIGVVFGLAGLSAFAANLILGGRVVVITRLFGGLDTMYRTHRGNGRVAFLLLLAHALLVLSSRATTSIGDALRTLSPALGWTVPFGLIALVAMAVAVGLTIYARLSHEVFVYVQRSFGVIFAFGALHAFMTPGTKAISPALTWYLAALSAAGLLAFGYRSLFGNILVLRHDYRVSKVNRLDEEAVEITMTPVDEPIRYTPGQFLFVTFYSTAFSARFHPFSFASEGETAIITLRPGDKRNQFHPFSITSAPSEKNLRVTVKAVGDFTRALHHLDEGAAARIEGPYGKFSYLNARRRRQIWIAGGIGVTPFLSMARNLDGAGYDIDLYYSTKRVRQSYFLDELEAIAARTPNFDLTHFPEDELGFLTADIIEEKSGDVTAADIFICGPPPMVKALRAQLRAKRVPESQIHFEEFGFGPKSS
jgi:predicted ferric reductase